MCHQRRIFIKGVGTDGCGNNCSRSRHHVSCPSGKITLEEQIRQKQLRDLRLQKIRQRIKAGKASDFQIDAQGALRFRDRLCETRDSNLKQQILEEAHSSLYTMHPGSTKMYQDIKKVFWWKNMKKEIARYVAECDICQRIKAEHQKPSGLLHPLPIPVWKWDEISMDFIHGLPRTPNGNDSIWVIVDRLIKSAHFIPINKKRPLPTLAKMYINEIVSLHGVPLRIVSDRDPRYLAKFWQSMHKALGSTLDYSTAYHPQTDGETERVNQVVEDMLRACVLEFQGTWDEYLPLAEFAYNNSYQASIQMAPYEALYGRKCRSPPCWDEIGERKIIGPDLIQETEQKIQIIRERLRVAQSRQKSYADNRRRDLQFEVGDWVYIKASPMKGIKRFRQGKKLSPRYVGPFQIWPCLDPKFGIENTVSEFL